MLVTLPFLLLLLDSWPLERFKYAIAWKLVWEKSPFFLLAVASCIVTFLAQKHGGAMVLMAQMSSAARMENALVSYGRYLGKLIWPENLAVLYPVVDHWPMHIVLLSAAVLLVASTASIATRRTHPYLATGWFWFLGTLVPVIGLVAIGEQAMADRYTYFPAIGILIMFAWGVEELTRGRRFQPQVTTALSVAILTGCILSTRQNIGYWKSSESLFRHVIAVTDNNYSAHCSLGNALLTEGRTQDALTEFQAALKLKPDSPENHCNLGVALANLNRMEEAIEEFQAAVKLQSNYGLAHHNLGMAFEQKGQLESATKEYQVAVKLMPTYVPARNSLGIALAKQGQLDAAVIQFREAVRLDPSFLPAQRNLKQALDLIGH